MSGDVRPSRSRCAGVNVRPRAPSRWRLGHEEEDLDDFSTRRSRVSGRSLPPPVCSRALSPPARAQALSSPRSLLLLILARTLLTQWQHGPHSSAVRVLGRAVRHDADGARGRHVPIMSAVVCFTFVLTGGYHFSVLVRPQSRSQQFPTACIRPEHHSLHASRGPRPRVPTP